MTASWTPNDLRRIDAADELQIAGQRSDGTLRRWLPIWVVCVSEQVYVRTWYRRNAGWFAHVLDSHRASIRVPGLQADVTVDDATDEPDQLRADIDAAYHIKYALRHLDRRADGDSRSGRHDPAAQPSAPGRASQVTTS